MIISRNAIVSKDCRIRYPAHFKVMSHSIVDDFCYFSTRVSINHYCHIAANCTVAGGALQHFYMGNFSCLASGVRVYCASDDFVHDLATVLPSNYRHLKNNLIEGAVYLGRAVTIGANSVVMPQNDIPEGVTIGALSFVPANFPFKSWTVYAGSPLKEICQRDKENVLRQMEGVLTHHD